MHACGRVFAHLDALLASSTHHRVCAPIPDPARMVSKGEVGPKGYHRKPHNNNVIHEQPSAPPFAFRIHLRVKATKGIREDRWRRRDNPGTRLGAGPGFSASLTEDWVSLRCSLRSKSLNGGGRMTLSPKATNPPSSHTLPFCHISWSRRHSPNVHPAPVCGVGC